MKMFIGYKYNLYISIIFLFSLFDNTACVDICKGYKLSARMLTLRGRDSTRAICTCNVLLALTPNTDEFTYNTLTVNGTINPDKCQYQLEFILNSKTVVYNCNTTYVKDTFFLENTEEVVQIKLKGSSEYDFNLTLTSSVIVTLQCYQATVPSTVTTEAVTYNTDASLSSTIVLHTVPESPTAATSEPIPLYTDGTIERATGFVTFSSPGEATETSNLSRSTSLSPKDSKGDQPSLPIIIGSFVGVVVLLVGVIIFLLCFMKRRRLKFEKLKREVNRTAITNHDNNMNNERASADDNNYDRLTDNNQYEKPQIYSQLGHRSNYEMLPTGLQTPESEDTTYQNVRQNVTPSDNITDKSDYINLPASVQ